MPLQEALTAIASAKPDARLLLAVSGGRDSLAMLHWFAAQSVWRDRVVVAHVNHGLNAGADHAEQLVRRCSASFALTCVAESVDTLGEIARSHLSVEAAARVLRYAALERLRVQTNCNHIITAHTQDDDAETVLMKLQQHATWFELVGMPMRRAHILRPFLKCTRADLRAVLPGNAVCHQDPMNSDLRFPRVRARHALALLPPHVSSFLARHGLETASSLNLAGRLANTYLNKCLRGNADPGTALENLPKNLYLEGLDFVLVEKALARRLDRTDFRLPAHRRRQILDFVNGRAPLATLPLCEGFELHRAGPHLWLAPVAVRPNSVSVELTNPEGAVATPAPFAHCASGELRLNPAALVGDPHSRLWSAGERFRPHRRRSRKIADWLHDGAVHPSVRNQWPVIHDELGIVAIPGLGVCERVAPLPTGHTLQIRWESTPTCDAHVA
ncbi:MAG: tRNA lysidine(34) synthetase TilS [bacterium]|nr:tRNA lysidine(34) synthetase TilS [bacterium]